MLKKIRGVVDPLTLAALIAAAGAATAMSYHGEANTQDADSQPAQVEQASEKQEQR